jgi:hypothetical protein
MGLFVDERDVVKVCDARMLIEMTMLVTQKNLKHNCLSNLFLVFKE